MEQLASAPRPPPHGSFGALLRTFRQRAYLSQEQLAARAELSERTVRNLEAGRVRSPRNDTMRLLADALELAGPERKDWFAATQAVNGQQAEPALPGAAGPVPRDAQGVFWLIMTCQIDRAGETVLAVQYAARYPAGRIDIVSRPASPLPPRHPVPS